MKTTGKEKIVKNKEAVSTKEKKEVSKYRHGKYQPGDEMIDFMLENYGSTREAIFGKEGWVALLTKRAVEKALAGELTYHLGYKERHEKPEDQSNYRNGYSKKSLQGEKKSYEIAIPRDREGSFDPIIIPKGEKRFREFDERIISLYTRGMTVREIKEFLEEEYGAEVSPDFISTVTDSVNEDVKEWQQRPLESNAEIAAERLQGFEQGPWGEKFPMITASWKRHWEEVIPFFSYSPEVRKMIYTTNAIESLHMQVRKVIKNRGHFPNDESATKLIYLALRNIEKAWIKAPVFWIAASREFTLQFGDRFKQS